MMTREVAVCVFYDPGVARDAMAALQEAGVAGEDISLLTPERESDKGTQARDGAATGAVAGGVFGGLAGWLVGLGSLAIPGIGPFVAAGALATALAGAAIGAGLGAVAGALVGMGVPEKDAKYYEQEVRNGRSLVAVRGRRADEAHDIMHEFGGYDAQHPQPATATRSRS
jgi:uncharacterized membrane protein